MKKNKSLNEKGYETKNPATQQVLFSGTFATPSMIEAAFERAQTATKMMESFTYKDRIALLKRIQEVLLHHKEQLAILISKEMGKPLWESRSEVDSVIQKTQLTLEASEKRQPIELSSQSSISYETRYKPLGIALVLGAFNFPLHLSAGHIFPLLLNGNIIIFKPSPITPLSSIAFIDCLIEAGMPPDFCQLILGDKAVAQTLIDYPFNGIFFTGSVAAGMSIHKQLAGRPEVLLALEMGGNNAIVVDSDADINASIYHTLNSAFITSGQRCSCARRIYLPDNAFGHHFLNSLSDKMNLISMGAYTDTPEPFIGPLASLDYAKKAVEQIQYYQQIGGTIITKKHDLALPFIRPTLINMQHIHSNNDKDEEIFAPVLKCYFYNSFEQAIQLANKTRYGLVLSLFSKNPEKWRQFYQESRAGLIHFNRPTTGASSLQPFGGVGLSGNFRPTGFFAIDSTAYPVSSIISSEPLFPEKTLQGLWHE
jgi:succinylglutamic semialdehyde dehydrogenase